MNIALMTQKETGKVLLPPQEGKDTFFASHTYRHYLTEHGQVVGYSVFSILESYRGEVVHH